MSLRYCSDLFRHVWLRSVHHKEKKITRKKENNKLSLSKLAERHLLCPLLSKCSQNSLRRCAWLVLQTIYINLITWQVQEMKALRDLMLHLIVDWLMGVA